MTGQTCISLSAVCNLHAFEYLLAQSTEKKCVCMYLHLHYTAFIPHIVCISEIYIYNVHMLWCVKGKGKGEGDAKSMYIEGNDD